jgi:hypothetical protein
MLLKTKKEEKIVTAEDTIRLLEEEQKNYVSVIEFG